MLEVSIFPPVVKKTMTVSCEVKGSDQSAKAVLVGASGEKLKTFLLKDADNVLSLDGIPAGAYTLRVESGSEVMVKQIIIPA